MKIDNEFYAEVLRIANDEVQRLENEHNLSEKNRQQIYVQAVSAATVICYHNELCEELKKYGIDIQIDYDDDDDDL